MIAPETAGESADLLSTAIAELTEDAHSDAMRVTKGDFSVVVIRADRLKTVGSDVAALAEAMAVLARRAGEGGEPA